MILRAALCALLLLALATPVAAQRGHMFGAPTERPIHAQLLASDRVAIGTVAEVSPGRIRFEDLRPVVGVVAAPLEVKRAPSHPPGLQPGERILLLLRGARSPYLLVPSRDEVVRIGDADAELRVADAIRGLHDALSEPVELMSRYQAWLTGPDDVLRHLAEVALTYPAPPLARPEPSYFLALATLACDSDRPPSVRRAAAQVAGSDANGVAALLASLPCAATDPPLLLDALRLGAVRASPETTGALLRSLRNPDVEIRRTALALGPVIVRDPTLRAEVERLAEEDPSGSLRGDAAALLRAKTPERRGSADDDDAP